MTHSHWIRIALGFLAVIALQIGVWAVAAPRSFYDNFPGLGRTWVNIDGPYNEHLIRDVGALNLALLVLLIAAAVTLSRQIIIVAALASLTWGVPHLVYHVFNTDGLDNVDILASLGGLFVSCAIPLAILFSVRNPTLDNSETM